VSARALTVVTALAAAMAGAPAAPALAQQVAPPPAAPPAPDTFPHALHEKLFTTCAACHGGIATGDTASVWPSPELCAGCHNGDLARKVTWKPHPMPATNVTFDHVAHVAMFQGMFNDDRVCQRCHATSDSLPFMDVGPAQPERCVLCHGNGAASMLAETSCEPCHTPLHDYPGLSVAQIRAFPRPPSHDSAGWVLHHQTAAQGSTCAVCHAQQFCATCHVNAATVPAIRKLPADDRVAELVRGWKPVYPVPPSHRSASWGQLHGAVARAGASECATCHAQESCIGCHRVQERVPAIAKLPRRIRGGAFGVDLAGLQPASHLPDMLLQHRTLAAGGTQSCNTCHRPSFCASCHEAARAPGFHGPDFVLRHAQQAYTNQAECAACHQTQVFCRDCHRMMGRTGTTVPVGKYHDNQPGWLFGHGGVARRAIETCASCHDQTFCLKCHSATTGWHINPHGPGFDPKVESKNPAMCLICHTTGVPTP
jgi:hypothetical protein